MPIDSLIRKNPITKDWEHWDDTSENWCPGLVGNNHLKSVDLSILPIRDDMNNIISYNEVDYPNTLLNINKEFTYNNSAQPNKIVNELIDVRKLTPIINTNIIEELGTDNLEILNGNNLIFDLDAYNPESDATDDLVFTWNIGENKIVTESNKITIPLNDSTYSGDFYVSTNNRYSSTTSSIANIIVHDPLDTNIFNVNLIENSGFNKGLEGWKILNGNPVIYPLWDNITQYGIFGWGSYDKPINDLFQDPSKYYFNGGSANDSMFTKISQTIDVSSISNYINKEISGVNSVSLLLYAYLGSWGNSKNYYFGLYEKKELSYISVNTGTPPVQVNVPKNLNVASNDEISIILSFLDYMGKQIGQKYTIKNVKHDLQFNDIYYSTTDFYLSGTYVIDIPFDTKKIEVEVLSEKSSDTNRFYNLRHWELPAILDGSVEAQTKLKAAFNKDHLTGLNNIALKIDVNNRYLQREIEKLK